MTPKKYSELIMKLFPIHDIHINALGLCGEAGEFANKIKQRIYKPVPQEEIVEELGDVLWHVTQCAHLLGSSLDELIMISAKKTINRNTKEMTD